MVGRCVKVMDSVVWRSGGAGCTPTKGGRVHQRKGGARSLEDAGEGSSRRVREHVRGRDLKQ